MLPAQVVVYNASITSENRLYQTETPEQVKEYIIDRFKQENLDYEEAIRIVRCESDFIPRQSECTKKNGTRENSWGVWQINLDEHDVTIEQAMDVKWSTEWSIEQIKNGNIGIWSCYYKT